VLPHERPVRRRAYDTDETHHAAVSLHPTVSAKRTFPDFGDLNATTQQLFEEVFGKNFPAQVEGWAPAVNMAETKDEYTVTAELPGLKPETSAATF